MKVTNLITTDEKLVFTIEEERMLQLEINLKFEKNLKFVENHQYYFVNGIMIFSPPDSFQSFSSKLSISKKIKYLTFNSFNIFKPKADFIKATFVDDEIGTTLNHYDRIWQKNTICPMNFISREKKFNGKMWIHVLIYEFTDKPLTDDKKIEIQEFLNAFK